MGTTPEAALTKRILERLERYRPAARFYKIKSAGRRGVPDILGVVLGQFVAFEVKCPHGKLAPLQDHEITVIRRAGGEAHMIRTGHEACLIVDRIIAGG